jgi:uncharacterized protein (TIGR03032 family)
VSTYQAGRVIFVSATDEGQLIQLPRAFSRPMALAVADGRLAVSTSSAVEVFVSEPRLAAAHPRRPKVYDTLYTPRTTHRTGNLDAHGVGWDADGALWVVNTRFDCLAVVEEASSFAPRWTPPFVADAAPGDRCHLNGLAFVDGKPRYATCLARSSEPEGWRDALGKGGLLLDVGSREVLLDGLEMPHSPCVVGDTLYLLLAGTGELARVAPTGGRLERLAAVGGFARGLAHQAGYLFVGFSRVRPDSAAFAASPVAAEATHAGVAVVDAATGEVVARMTWRSSVEELFDVAVLPAQRPGLIGPRQADRGAAVTTPGGAWWLSAHEPEAPASPWPHLDPEGDLDGAGSWYTEYVAATSGGVNLASGRDEETVVEEIFRSRSAPPGTASTSRRDHDDTPNEYLPAREARTVEAAPTRKGG